MFVCDGAGSNGDADGRVFEIDAAAVTVGRGHANDIPLDDEFASTQHARLESRADGVWLEDVGSTNGTAVNGTLIDGPRKLSPGDVIRIGRHRPPLREMSVIRTASLTDPGRRRRHNEDAFVCEPPLFAIADGMGGAQAGELASRLAAAVVGRARGGGPARAGARGGAHRGCKPLASTSARPATSRFPGWARR